MSSPLLSHPINLIGDFLHRSSAVTNPPRSEPPNPSFSRSAKESQRADPIIFQRHPESFSGIVTAGSSQPTEFQHFFPILAYFSLTTLSTLGFGDITPLTLQARYAAVAEGITGQFYLAILVARLVGLQMSRVAATQQADPQTPDLGTKESPSKH